MKDIMYDLFENVMEFVEFVFVLCMSFIMFVKDIICAIAITIAMGIAALFVNIIFPLMKGVGLVLLFPLMLPLFLVYDLHRIIGRQ